jgi:hypothetical protein
VDAWRDLAAELEQQLRERDPGARVHATVAPSGLLQLVVRTDPTQLAAAQALARRYEERARTVCERCGGAVGAAGPVPWSPSSAPTARPERERDGREHPDRPPAWSRKAMPRALVERDVQVLGGHHPKR